MFKSKLKKGDFVIILSGKDKGKTGKILKMIPLKSAVVIENCNIQKKHQKPSKENPGKIIDKEMPLHVSNVALYNTSLNKKDKIKFKIENGKKIRMSSLSNETIDL